ncbi:MAG: hypothetical protein ACLS5M_10180 [Ruminococcus sp.]
MIGITGYKQVEATSFSELPKLQPGGYVLKILNVKVEPTDWGSRLAIQFDIAEGEFKGFLTSCIRLHLTSGRTRSGRVQCA